MNTADFYPLSKTKSIKGTRRIAREKVLQILSAFYISDSSVENLFSHIFFRQFNFGDGPENNSDKLLRPDEVYELEADVPIQWKEDEIEFGKKLIRETLQSKEYIDELIDKYARNWELERIALIDRVLMQMAATELMQFPEIPPKVSINEALDIAKIYSTDKSRIFINGVLDSLLEELKKDSKLNKTGRGLIEN